MNQTVHNVFQQQRIAVISAQWHADIVNRARRAFILFSSVDCWHRGANVDLARV